jgi:urease accessory protein
MNPLALLLADSRFPSGSYAHSLGLEQAVTDGLTDVPRFIRARLRLVAAADARFAVEAHRCIHLAYRGQAPVYDLHTRLEREWAARTPSPVLREAARRLGAQLLRSAATVWPGGEIARYRVESDGTPRPIALGVVAAVAGVSEQETALLALYDDAATVASAALKLLPLDPAVTARWLADLAPQLSLMARSVVMEQGPLPAPAAAAVELSAPIHLEQRERLFAS